MEDVFGGNRCLLRGRQLPSFGVPVAALTQGQPLVGPRGPCKSFVQRHPNRTQQRKLFERLCSTTTGAILQLVCLETPQAAADL